MNNPIVLEALKQMSSDQIIDALCEAHSGSKNFPKGYTLTRNEALESLDRVIGLLTEPYEELPEWD